MKISVSDYIIKRLSKEKISNVPVFQGGAIIKLIDDIGESKIMDYYCPLHEQALAMEVDAEARIRGFSAGFVTSGPGGTNLMTGLACAFYDSIPCIFFTGQVGNIHIKGSRKIRQRGFQETDMVAIYKPITKFAIQIKKAENIGYLLDKSIFLAKNGRPGPVLIDLPYDVQRVIVDTNKLKKFNPNEIKIYTLPKNIKSIIVQISKMLKNSKKPIFLVGGGVRLSNSHINFLKIIENTNIPFVTSWSAQDITNSDYKFYHGSIGRNGHQSANKAIKSADLIISLGQRFAVKSLVKNFASNAKIIAVDIDNHELNQGLIKPDLKIQADLRYFIPYLEKSLNYGNEKKKYSNWNNELSKLKKLFFETNVNLVSSEAKKYVNPFYFFRTYSKLIKSRSYIFTDTGANLTWCMQSFISKKKQRIISAWGNSPMGYSVAASIGVSINNTKKYSIYAFIGDGSLMINLQELHFISKHKLPIKVIVMDNKSLGNTKLGALKLFEGRTHANDSEHGYYPPNVKSIANCFDFKLFEIKNNIDLERKLKKIEQYKKHCIVHVNISEKQETAEY